MLTDLKTPLKMHNICWDCLQTNNIIQYLSESFWQLFNLRRYSFGERRRRWQIRGMRSSLRWCESHPMYVHHVQNVQKIPNHGMLADSTKLWQCWLEESNDKKKKKKWSHSFCEKLNGPFEILLRIIIAAVMMFFLLKIFLVIFLCTSTN